MKKISTATKNWERDFEIMKEPMLTIGLGLGDRTSHYRSLGEAGKRILEPKGIHRAVSSKTA